jgi:hypothetical protein
MSVLAAWAMPYTHYTLTARAEAVQRYVTEAIPLEQAAPVVQGGDRVADPGTLRRWFRRRLQSL